VKPLLACLVALALAAPLACGKSSTKPADAGRRTQDATSAETSSEAEPDAAATEPPEPDPEDDLAVPGDEAPDATTAPPIVDVPATEIALPEGIESLPRPGRTPLAPPDLPAPAAGEMVSIPATLFLRGSWPGGKGRDAAREVDLAPTKVNAFEIDRLPFPGDPAQDASTNVTRQEAERRCADAGKRLCTEIEWELACKGAQSQDYPYGDDYDEGRYGDAGSLVSSWGVLGMTGLYEWTAGDWKDPKGTATPNIAPVRGAPPGEGDAASRRCATRTGVDPARGSPRVGFRCCRGQGFPLAYEVEPVRRAVRAAPLLNDAMLARLVRSVPELRRVWAAPRIQSDNVQTQALLRSSRTESSGIGFAITIQPVFWIPAQGEELMCVVGRSENNVFAAALYTTGIPDLYVHAASMVLTAVEEGEGIALFGGLRDRKLLGWGECDDCREGGSFEYHEEDRTITVGHRW
jgi:formylglycine-generating enzyme required for sulfatase activity